MRKRFETLRAELSGGKLDSAAYSAKLTQASDLEAQIKRKTEDAQVDIAKRQRVLIEPLSAQVYTALTAFAKQRGIDVILDRSRLSEAMMLVNESVDITKQFTAEYNKIP